jgi:hypothetical protein
MEEWFCYPMDEGRQTPKLLRRSGSKLPSLLTDTVVIGSRDLV